MSVVLALALRLLPPCVAVLLGYVAGGTAVFARRPDAIAALNGYVLYVAFPLLIVLGTADPSHAVPTHPAFYLAHLALFAAWVPALAILGRSAGSVRDELGAIALGAIFGNIAYVGLPFIVSVLGDESVGLASVGVALHVALAMTLGPALLLRWQGGERRGLALVARRLVRQPLVWAPLVGLLLRSLPASVLEHLLPPLAPVAASAPPVALFMLGLYLRANTTALRSLDAPALVLSAGKLLASPALALALAWPLWRAGLIDALEARVFVLLAAVPTAIAAFSLAHELALGEATVARGIVLTTVLSLVSLPLVGALTLALIA
ncbi:MAG: AEC family transporter [Deltaproteobacteria bacterium]|nr:AEC family transporter [Deltaproteobacteria bacterium]MCB9787547.1 AEC family transporter [Deltaproteobacteria bacterium]